MTTAVTKREVQLGVIQETLLIPLYFRAKETSRRGGICSDPYAVQIMESLNYDFKRFDSGWLQLDIAIRTEIFDERVNQFLADHPATLIINLGAGLDGRFFRLDDGRVIWFDLDMPDSIELRNQFYATSERNFVLPYSMFDYQWLEEVKPYLAGREVLVIAEGLFCYFTEAQVKDLFKQLAENIPGVEILFQSISPEYVGQAKNVDAVKRTKAEFFWGCRDGAEVAAWNKDYEFLGDWALIDRHRWRWGLAGWVTAFSRRQYRLLRDVMKISHLRLG
jgi:O-methyltransferase involved in polyketide biosynthesis